MGARRCENHEEGRTERAGELTCVEVLEHGAQVHRLLYDVQVVGDVERHRVHGLVERPGVSVGHQFLQDLFVIPVEVGSFRPFAEISLDPTRRSRFHSIVVSRWVS
jgi:hypothetical protein